MNAATDRRSPDHTADQARRLIEQQGLRIDPFGVGWRVHGPGVDILTATFEWVGPLDIQPRSC